MESLRSGLIIASLLGHVSNDVYQYSSKTKSSSDIMTSGQLTNDEKRFNKFDPMNKTSDRNGNLLYSAGGVGYIAGQASFPDIDRVNYQTGTDVEVDDRKSAYAPNNDKIYQKFKPVKRGDYGTTRNYENEVKEANANYIAELNKYNTVF